MRDTPRSRATVGDIGTGPPQLRPGRALAHTPGASGSGSPHRSDGRPPQTPRGARHTDLDGRPGTSPPVPGRPTAFSGRPAALAALALLFLFCLLAGAVAVDGPVRRADERLGRAVADGGSAAAGGAGAWNRVAEFFADLGNVPVAVPVLVVVCACAALRARRADLPRWWLPPVAALVLMALVPALVVPLKEAVGRPGPPGTDGDGYFPSGHTATSSVAYGAAVLLLLPLARGALVRSGLAAGCALLLAAVGLGLVRRGYHWPLDVLGSWVLSAMLLIGLDAYLRRSRDRDRRHEQREQQPAPDRHGRERHPDPDRADGAPPE